MLSPTNEQISHSLYDYYLDDNLSAVDDQPIDYSKRYSDLETDDVSKPSRKKRQFSTLSVSSQPSNCKQHCEDDLRVYCIEGTPLLISSSSSMCDLRDIGISDTVEVKKSEPRYPISEDLKSPIETYKEGSVLQEERSAQISKEEKSDECNEDDKDLNLYGKSSKASSPLMFSRSSSVCSLNSFEQHSIVDDQSSVSVFSNMTSGIISPSEIPDSPGEAMSPFVHKSKQSELFKFPICDSEKEVALTDPKLNYDAIENESFVDILPDDDVKVYNIEGDCSSMSSFSELSVHTSSQMSITYGSEHNQNCLSIEQKTSLKIRCIKNIESSSPNDFKASKKNCIGSHVGNQDNTYSSSKILMDSFEENIKTYSTNEQIEDFSEMESSHDVEACLSKKDLPISLDADKVKNNADNEDDQVTDNCHSSNQSDDETDALLEECIRNGKPGGHSYDLEENKESDEICSSLNESDDEAYSLLEECIEKGKPEKSPIKVKESSLEDKRYTSEKNKFLRKEEIPEFSFKEYHLEENNSVAVKNYPEFEKSHKPISEKPRTVNALYSQPNKYFKHKSINTDPCLKTKQCLPYINKQPEIIHSRNISPQGKKYRCQQSPHTYYGMKPFRPLQQDRVSDPMGKLRKEILIGLYRNLSEDKVSKKVKQDSDSEDDELLVKHCIKLGMPDEKCKKHMQHNPNVNYNGFESSSNQNSVQRLSRTNLAQYSRMRDNFNSKVNNLQYQVKSGQCQRIPQCCYNQSSIKDGSKENLKINSQSLKKQVKCKSEDDLEEEGDNLIQQYIQLGMPKVDSRNNKTKEIKNYNFQFFDSDLGYRDNHRPDGASDDDNDDILLQCINAGKPKQPFPNKSLKQNYTSPNKLDAKVPFESSNDCSEFYKRQSSPLSTSKKLWGPPFVPDDYTTTSVEEWPCVYKTEDTPLLSPTASISDLSSLSFNEDKSGTHNHLNNSRNSDCSSDSDEDDELLLQCIQSGMPVSERAVA